MGNRGKAVVVVVLMAIGMTAVPGISAAQESWPGYVNGSTRKLGRGLANILTAPLEFIREPALVSQRDGNFAGATVGLVRAVVSTVVREVAGVVEVVTFLIPVPNNFEPLVRPEFLYANGDWVP